MCDTGSYHLLNNPLLKYMFPSRTERIDKSPAPRTRSLDHIPKSDRGEREPGQGEGGQVVEQSSSLDEDLMDITY